LDTHTSVFNAKPHRNIHPLQADQKLVIEILDDKPTIPIDSSDTSSASMGNASAARTTNQLEVANQQVRMAVLGSKLATLAASGSISRTMNSAGVNITDLNVNIPQVSVAPPVGNAVGSSGSQFFVISIDITFAGATRSKFMAAVTQLQTAIAGALNDVTIGMVQILSISEFSRLQSSLRSLEAQQSVNRHHHSAATRQELSGPFVAVSIRVNFSSAVAAMTAGFIVSSDPQVFATAVTSSLSRAFPADFSSVAVFSLMLGNVPGMLGVLNFTVQSAPSPDVSGLQNFTVLTTPAPTLAPTPAPTSAPALAPTSAPADSANGGMSSDVIAMITIGAIFVGFFSGGLVWWKLKRSSVAAVWPKEENETAVVKFTTALDSVQDTSSALTVLCAQPGNILKDPSLGIQAASFGNAEQESSFHIQSVSSDCAVSNQDPVHRGLMMRQRLNSFLLPVEPVKSSVIPSDSPEMSLPGIPSPPQRVQESVHEFMNSLQRSNVVDPSALYPFPVSDINNN
jgi:hypothetical protein